MIFNIFSSGFKFRFGQTLKDAGVRMARVRLFGIPILKPFCGPVIKLGVATRESVMRRCIGEL
jgi:hypothetical protein